MIERVDGLHHVTAICGDPQTNIDFYVGVLGLRLVKQTVNFDDPRTYHLYYGDEHGSPGSLITFFAWPGATRGGSGALPAGTGRIARFSLSVAAGTLWFWQQRLAAFGGNVEGPLERFGRQRLQVRDPDGIELELVADPAETRNGWPRPQIPAEYAIRGLYGVCLAVESAANSAEFLVSGLGFSPCDAEHGLQRFVAPGATGPAGGVQCGGGPFVELVERPTGPPAPGGVGSVHHVAWNCRDDAAQQRIQAQLAETGIRVTEVKDRRYFRSIYFREPGAVLFETATAGPGFAVDEQPHALGARLQLPQWLESRRAEITRGLPRIHIPESFNPEVSV